MSLRRSIAAAVLSLGALTADGRPCVAEPPGRVLVYRAESWAPRGTATRRQIAATAIVVSNRLVHAGLDGASVAAAPTGDRVEVHLPSRFADSEPAARRLAERRGAIAFRVRAEESVEQEYRERRLEGGAAVPPGHVWTRFEREDAQALVEEPERVSGAALLVALTRVVATKPTAFGDAVAAHAAVLRASVFTNEEIAAASVRRTMSTHGAQFLPHVAVRFEFRDERRAAFEKFTGEHVGRAMCVVADGRVHVCPLIKSALPGAGELRAPGTGYTDEEAREMAALLECGPLPCRLEPEGDK